MKEHPPGSDAANDMRRLRRAELRGAGRSAARLQQLLGVDDALRDLGAAACRGPSPAGAAAHTAASSSSPPSAIRMPLARSMTLRPASCCSVFGELRAQRRFVLEARDRHLQHRLEARGLQAGDDVGADAGAQRVLDRLGPGVLGEDDDRAGIASPTATPRFSSVSRVGDSLSTMTTSGASRCTQSWSSGAESITATTSCPWRASSSRIKCTRCAPSSTRRTRRTLGGGRSGNGPIGNAPPSRGAAARRADVRTGGSVARAMPLARCARRAARRRGSGRLRQRGGAVGAELRARRRFGAARRADSACVPAPARRRPPT